MHLIKAFSKFIYLKYFEIDDKSILKIIKKILIIYKNKNRRLLLVSLLKWNEKLYTRHKKLSNIISNQLTAARKSFENITNETSTKSPSSKRYFSRSNSINNIKSEKRLNIYNEHCNLLYYDNEIRKIKNLKRINDFSLKQGKECTFSPKINSNYNYLFSNNSCSRFEMLYKENQNILLKKSFLCRENDKSLEEICTFSPRTNRDYIGSYESYRKELNKNNSNKNILDKFKINEEIDQKKSSFNNATQQRINFLHNLHKGKEFNLKRLEHSFYQENGITFKPKLNENYSSLYKVSSCQNLENKQLQKKNKSSLRNSTNNETPLKESQSCKNISKQSSPKKTDCLKTTNKFSNNQSYFQNNPAHNDICLSSKIKRKQDILMTSKSEKKLLIKGNQKKIRSASTRYSIQNSKELTGNNNIHNSNVYTSSNKNLITLENNFRNIENNDLQNTNRIKTEERKLASSNERSKIGQNDYLSTYEVLNTNNNKKCITDYNLPTKKLNSLPINPFLIENFTDKKLLDLANTYITTDESLDKFQTQINERYDDIKKNHSIKMKKIKLISKIESNICLESLGRGHKITNKLIKYDNYF